MPVPPDVDYPMEPFEWGLLAVWVWCFQLLLWLEICRFSFSEFGRVKMDPTRSVLLTLGWPVIWLTLGKTLGHEKLPKSSLKKNSRTTGRMWHKSFSMIQSAGIQNWVPQLIIKLERFNLLFLSVTGLYDLCDNVKCAW